MLGMSMQDRTWATKGAAIYLRLPTTRNRKPPCAITASPRPAYLRSAVAGGGGEGSARTRAWTVWNRGSSRTSAGPEAGGRWGPSRGRSSLVAGVFPHRGSDLLGDASHRERGTDAIH